MPRLDKDMTSVISSRVPIPPGNATKASASSIILDLRSAMVFVSISCVRPVCFLA